MNIEPKDKLRLEAAASLETVAAIVRAASENLKNGNKLVELQEVDASLMADCASAIQAIAKNVRDAIGKP